MIQQLGGVLAIFFCVLAFSGKCQYEDVAVISDLEDFSNFSLLGEVDSVSTNSMSTSVFLKPWHKKEFILKVDTAVVSLIQTKSIALGYESVEGKSTLLFVDSINNTLWPDEFEEVTYLVPLDYYALDSTFDERSGQLLLIDTITGNLVEANFYFELEDSSQVFKSAAWFEELILVNPEYLFSAQVVNTYPRRSLISYQELNHWNNFTQWLSSQSVDQWILVTLSSESLNPVKPVVKMLIHYFP